MSDVNFNLLCRVCLCKSSKMFALQCTFSETVDSVNKEHEDDNTVIQHALSALFNNMEYDTEKWPQQICSMCLGILKIAYDFKILFEESHQVILQYLEEPIVQNNSTNSFKIDKGESNSSVEVIVGSKKYDLKDLVIVEQENCIEKENFEGFLRNLGTVVSATFTRTGASPIPKSHKKQEILSPELEVIKKLYIESDFEPVENIVIKSDGISNTVIHSTKDCDQNIESFSCASETEYSNDDLIKSAMSLKYECKLCHKVYSSKTRFQKHVGICGQKNLSSAFQCEYCLKIFNTTKSLNSHLKLHSNLYLYCELCDQKFSTRSSLYYHKSARHSESKYICQVCGKNFAVVASLNAHMQVHDKNKTQCICPVCGKTFHYKGGLFYHMKQHTNERKYHCDYCDKMFYTLTAKKRHTFTHTGMRPYECQFCQKRFFSTGELKKHVYIHTGVLPYKCKYCDKGFRSSFNMKVHWFNHSGNCICDYCYRGFITKDVLLFHCKMKHKNLITKKID